MKEIRRNGWMFVSGLEDLERILATNRNFLLGPWLGQPYFHLTKFLGVKLIFLKLGNSIRKPVFTPTAKCSFCRYFCTVYVNCAQLFLFWLTLLPRYKIYSRFCLDQICFGNIILVLYGVIASPGAKGNHLNSYFSQAFQTKRFNV